MGTKHLRRSYESHSHEAACTSCIRVNTLQVGSCRIKDSGRQALAQSIDQHVPFAASALTSRDVVRIRITVVVTSSDSLSDRLAITRLSALWTLTATLQNNGKPRFIAQQLRQLGDVSPRPTRSRPPSIRRSGRHQTRGRRRDRQRRCGGRGLCDRLARTRRSLAVASGPTIDAKP
jgi:hypothetical protein